MLLLVALALLTGLLVSQVANFATTVYLHRTLSHRAITMRPALSFGFRLLLWMTTGIAAREWVAVHRKHHAHTDTDEDPHSPARLGWLRVQLTNVALYRRTAADPEVLRRYAKDVPPDRWDRILFDHAFLGLGLGIALLVFLFGWWAALLAAGVHTVVYLSMSGAVNAVAHTFGRRTYDNSATNVQWLAFLTGGEGLHNNHHEMPTSARFSFHRGEFDPSWSAIRLLLRLGWLSTRLEAPRSREMASVG